ncbi:adenosine kinase [Parabacteroides sp. ZJ-118]|uniref:adenosine kinase n=1 Tax=Parabacteroides sp. ZJ-118 TaxID=2709398 RepID=UPI0013ED6598|nr:adenosine kinase [Parabacteroides sp. ZJ-118]
MNTIGLGNALVDVLLRLETDEVLREIGMRKGAMDMIDRDQMIAIRTAQEHLPRTRTPGGSVCNTMRAMSYLGASSGFIGKIGDDAVGEFYKDAIEKAGVTPHLIRTEGVSGSCTVLISPDGERTMGTFLGPGPTIMPEEITEEMLSPYQCIYIEGYLLVNEPLVRSTMEKARRLGLKVALDLSNFNIVNTFKGMLEDIIPKYVDILFANESEAEAYTGQKAAEAVRTLSEQVEVSLVTLGREGALIGSHGQFYSVPAEGGKPVDTTGAGDNFAAGFLYGQSVGASFVRSARIGSILAGYVIDVVGPQIPDDKWEQIKLKVKGILA